MSDKLDVVRKLLAKAERAGSAAEAQTYTDKAIELMARHGIDAAVLAAAAAEPDGIGQTRLTVSDPYSAGKARLLGWTSAALGCRWVQHGVHGGRVAAVTIVGHHGDREHAELLYTSLLLQATTQLLRVRPPWSGESVAAYRRSWLYGFARAVHDRLVAARDAAAREAQVRRSGPDDAPVDGAGRSVALVLADRSAMVDRAVAAAFPTLVTARPSTLSGSGAAAGVAAGTRADLGIERLAPARERLIGRRAG